MDNQNQPSSSYSSPSAPPGNSISRQSLAARDIVDDIWTSLNLPRGALSSLSLPGHDQPAVPSSFKIGLLAQSSIAVSALAAALLSTTRPGRDPDGAAASSPRVRVPLEHAVIEFKSERLYALAGGPHPPPVSRALGGLHAAADGFVRVHDAFPNHVAGTLRLLGLPRDATREDVAARISTWKGVELETAATEGGDVAIYALRSYEQWDALPQAAALDDAPISLAQISPTPVPRAMPMPGNARKCLSGLRVVEMSRVIAAPVAGRTLAAHGADVLWVTSANLPSLPSLDRDLARGKRSIQLDIHSPDDKRRLLELLKTCDVFIQGFRPGSLAAYGLSPPDLARANPGIVCASLSTFGPRGPWAHRRGFDSLVQTCSGMNVSEAAHAGRLEAARPTPCQALDHASGHLLAAGIAAALYRRGTQGGSWQVDVSLAGVMKYLRSLGQYPGDTGFACADVDEPADAPAEMLETRETGFGRMTAVRHSAEVEGMEVGWENAIRVAYYQGNNSEVSFADPGGHSDHCFSYLAQTLMCHADVGVMTTTWQEEAGVHGQFQLDQAVSEL
ncbi:Uncharacterized protein TCAP_04940 [Tolypocladium capitatum]|uniref:CoA-transferase family III n=1 Tax=Tolypocladium capitatum TaxID=45235 RepID=A0A2K3QC60_9HYPO|nr:Uncharacterized protein TCAP_04940 [Tolypocladium capitatum]